MPNKTPSAPPLAPLAFRVGIVGHRPDRLKSDDLAQLARVIQNILSVIKAEVLKLQQQTDLYSKHEPILRAYSPLAEGSDRIFAREVRKLGYQLCAVLPFPRDEFAKDFAPGSKYCLEANSQESFDDLYRDSVVKFELDGSRAEEGLAYGVAGRTVLNQSDILIVVWDGLRQNKRGGTEETLDEARRMGVPVVWVDAWGKHPWQLLDGTKSLGADASTRCAPDTRDDTQPLQRLVQEALQLPLPKAQLDLEKEANPDDQIDSPVEGLKLYYQEKQPAFNWAFLWKAFRDVVADRKWPDVPWSIQPFEDSVKKEWPDSDGSVHGGIIERLRPYYAWTDNLAVLYSNWYRSAFLFAFILAALAVLLALLPIAFGMTGEQTGEPLPHRLLEHICTVLELFFIGVILLLIYAGRQAKWHERWLNYRIGAELIRHIRMVAPLGGARPFPQIPAHWAIYGQPTSTWMAWYARAVERELGLPTTQVNHAYSNTCLDQLMKLVEDQIDFHRKSVARNKTMDHRLHALGKLLLYLTLGCCMIHIATGFLPERFHLHWLAGILTFCCGFLPAVGASLLGIINQGEFRRVEKRSRSMYQQLNVLLELLKDCKSTINAEPDKQHSQKVSSLAADITRLMIQEVLEWRVVFLDRPLVPPG